MLPRSHTAKLYGENVCGYNVDMEHQEKKAQPFQRHEDEGPTKLYVDAKPWEAAPEMEESDRRSGGEGESGQGRDEKLRHESN